VTGYGERVQGSEISQSELDRITTTMHNLAGMAVLTFKKKEKLLKLVDSVLMDSEDAWNDKG
jgi:hypothetical protein